MNILKEQKLFYSPDTTEELISWCEKLSSPGERTVALTVFGMTWNLCAKLTQSSDEEEAIT